MRFPRPEEVDYLRQQYVGKRIKVNFMPEDPNPVPAGTLGTCTMVDDAGSLLMKWDNGRTLSLIPGVDSFDVLRP